MTFRKKMIEQSPWTGETLVLPDNFIVPFLQLWALSRCLTANCYRPYNIWLPLIHAIIALSRRVWPLWFAALFHIQSPGSSGHPVSREALYSSISTQTDIFTKLQNKRNYFTISSSHFCVYTLDLRDNPLHGSLWWTIIFNNCKST